MKKASANCPNCGSLVEFKSGASLVSVCPSCSTLVARKDRRIEDHGKVAAVVITDTPIHLLQTGRFRDHPFTVVGHVQYQHAAGGFWDEWYVLFPGDRWAVIAEAQGKRYLTRSRKITSHMSVPAWEELSVGRTAKLVGTSIKKEAGAVFEVREFGTAILSAAEGELPFNTVAGSPYRFADLVGPGKGFATLHYGSQGKIELFLGQEVSLVELGISAKGASPDSVEDFEPTMGEGVGLECPKCGGTLELRAPDQSQRVTCPYCASLLDIQGSKLEYLKTLDFQLKPIIPLGTEGTVFGTKYTVIGFMQRVVRFDREYAWDEYLLYEKSVGFRWLVHSDLHWSFVEPADDVKSIRNGVSYEDRRYRIFQRAWASVIHVYGEFYWKVSVGEKVLAVDYISPPYMLTLEMTPVGSLTPGLGGCDDWKLYNYSESVASRGTYMDHETIEKGFGLPRLARGAAIAPNQPAPSFLSIFVAWPFFVAMLIGIDIVFSYFSKQPVSHAWTVIAIILLSLYPIAMMVHLHAFERSRWADSDYSPYQRD